MAYYDLQCQKRPILIGHVQEPSHPIPYHGPSNNAACRCTIQHWTSKMTCTILDQGISECHPTWVCGDISAAAYIHEDSPPRHSNTISVVITLDQILDMDLTLRWSYYEDILDSEWFWARVRYHRVSKTSLASTNTIPLLWVWFLANKLAMQYNILWDMVSQRSTRYNLSACTVYHYSLVLVPYCS